MIRTQVSLDEEMYQQAQEEARRQGISFAELCRRALARALSHRHGDRPWLRFAGAVESGSPDASQTVDEVVYGRQCP
ncbi:MAG: ribbon-helix-helix protein, CopG family [Sandaracinaceae bacterium]|nr:ribbon-helix-helix protein, CopG family [Sandaracinaceae bacterium]